jgi:hypothetical protein
LPELSNADLIWNRACDGNEDSLLEGDLALAALLFFQNEASNNGILHAVESIEPDDFDAAKSGYGFFGFHDAVCILDDAKSMAESDSRRDSLEPALDRRYHAVLGDDSALFERFAAFLRLNPSEFAAT